MIDFFNLFLKMNKINGYGRWGPIIHILNFCDLKTLEILYKSCKFYYKIVPIVLSKNKEVMKRYEHDMKDTKFQRFVSSMIILKTTLLSNFVKKIQIWDCLAINEDIFRLIKMNKNKITEKSYNFSMYRYYIYNDDVENFKEIKTKVCLYDLIRYVSRYGAIEILNYCINNKMFDCYDIAIGCTYADNTYKKNKMTTILINNLNLSKFESKTRLKEVIKHLIKIDNYELFELMLNKYKYIKCFNSGCLAYLINNSMNKKMYDLVYSYGYFEKFAINDILIYNMIINNKTDKLKFIMSYIYYDYELSFDTLKELLKNKFIDIINILIENECRVKFSFKYAVKNFNRPSEYGRTMDEFIDYMNSDEYVYYDGKNEMELYILSHLSKMKYGWTTIYNMVEHCIINPPHKDIYKHACLTGEYHIVVDTIHEVDIIDLNTGFNWACENGHTDIVIFIIESNMRGFDPSTVNNYALRKAKKNKHFNIVEMIEDL